MKGNGQHVHVFSEKQPPHGFYFELVETLKDYVVLSTDKKGTITTWNSGAETIFGYTKEEIAGKHFSLLFTPEARKEKVPEKELKTAYKKGKAPDERWHLTKHGKMFWAFGYTYPLYNSLGKHTGYVKALRDFTEKKNIENNLSFLAKASKILSSSLDYKKTLQSVAKIAVPHIADWCTVHLLDNAGIPKQVALAHIDPKKVKWAKTLQKKYPPNPDAPTGIPQVIRSCKAELYPVIPQEVLVKAAKDTEHLRLLTEIGFESAMIVPIIHNKQPLGAISFIATSESDRHYTTHDLSMAEEVASRASLAIINATLYQASQKEIEERKKTEEQLRRTQAQFQALYNANIIGVIYANSKGKIFNANEAFLQTIGYTRKELEKGKINWNTITPLEYKEIDKQKLKELRKKGTATPWEKEFVKKDGSQVPVIIGTVMLNPVTGENIAFVLDITERKRLEQRKDEFIGIASHELKTPLTSIKGYTQILERIIEELGNERAKMLLSKTNTYVNRLNSLIGDLLDVSKIQAGKLQLNKEHFDFHDLVKDVIEGLQQTSTTHTILCENCIHAHIYGDKHRLEQVFTNLLTNAIKYSPKADKVIVNIQAEKDIIKVSVTDFGVGIPKKDQNKLFQRFYRVEKMSRQFSGLGIGLYISAEIVARHKGQIWVESKEKQGSTFFFTLPINKKK